MGNKHFFLSIILAIFIHTVLLFAYFNENTQSEGTIGKGKDGLIVGVGISGSYTENTKKNSNVQETIEKEQLKSDTKSEIEQKTESKPKQKSEVKPETKPKQKSEIKQKTEPKSEVNKPKKEVETNLESTQEIQNKSETTQKAEDISNNNQSSQSTQTARKATGTGQHQEAGGDIGSKMDYLSIIKTRISNAKEYPKSARKEGVTGTTIVRFLLKLDGKVKDIQIINSSGDERLDQEAIKMIKKASPFPAIPEDVSNEPLELTLPIEFSLKTIKNKFY